MSNITPTKPSFVFGYWRPWNENSNFFDSYLDYAKDVSLVKYGADTVGKYINQASKEQVQAINQLGQAIGRGIDVLSNQMSDINETLVFLNRNMDVQVEQQKLSNLLLQNIAELLRVPDSEKERQHSIELGIKFFVNASKDADLYADALEQLLKAETLMKQDYFVLHRIGCIYLYVEKYINPEKALDYFLRAAKYASVESDPSAIRLYNALTTDPLQENKRIKELNRYEYETFNWEEVPNLSNSKKYSGWYIDRSTFNLYTVYQGIEDGYKCSELDRIYFRDIINDSKSDWDLQKELNKIQSDIDAILSKYTSNNDILLIQNISSELYEKAAFAAYVLGRFEDAVNYQSKTLKLNPTPENRFILSKYQVRNKNIKEAIDNLDKSINETPLLAIATFKEIDLINEPEVIKLIAQKNDAIDHKIKQLTEKWKTVESTNAREVIYKLTELSQKSYEIKIADFNKYEKEGNTIKTGLTKLEANIDAYINEIKTTTYCTFDADKIQKIIKELQLAKDLPLEKMQAVFDKLKKETDADKLKIGSKYGGGIVFHIDKTGKHGLVCADKDFGEAIWGGDGKIGALDGGIADGSGMANTKKIVELASWYIEKGWFKSTKTPAPTAARLCKESNYNGYTDWYLPNSKELIWMFLQKSIYDLCNFTSGNYWSSSESSILEDTYAYTLRNLEDIGFDSGKWTVTTKKGSIDGKPKKELHHVRAVRAF